MKLSGRLPHEIGDLAKLNVIDLSTNDLTGPIPINIHTTRQTGCIATEPHSSLRAFGYQFPELARINFRILRRRMHVQR